MPREELEQITLKVVETAQNLLQSNRQIKQDFKEKADREQALEIEMAELQENCRELQEENQRLRLDLYDLECSLAKKDEQIDAETSRCFVLEEEINNESQASFYVQSRLQNYEQEI